MKTLIRLQKEQSDLGLHSFVSPISPNSDFTVYNILNIMHNMPSEKYFDTVSEC